MKVPTAEPERPKAVTFGVSLIALSLIMHISNALHNVAAVEETPDSAVLSYAASNAAIT